MRFHTHMKSSVGVSHTGNSWTRLDCRLPRRGASICDLSRVWNIEARTASRDRIYGGVSRTALSCLSVCSLSRMQSSKTDVASDWLNGFESYSTLICHCRGGRAGDVRRQFSGDHEQEWHLPENKLQATNDLLEDRRGRESPEEEGWFERGDSGVKTPLSSGQLVFTGAESDPQSKETSTERGALGVAGVAEIPWPAHVAGEGSRNEWEHTSRPAAVVDHPSDATFHIQVG